MKIKRINYYGFNHKKVYKQYNCIQYLGDYTVNGEYKPVAFYHAPNYDKSKGHKEFILLQVLDGSGLIRGMDLKEASKWISDIPGLWCNKCDTVIYSTMRHDMCSCNCLKNSVSIDGGADYQKISYSKNSQYKKVRVNLINRKIRYLK